MIPPGYEITEEIGGQKLFCLYRAIRNTDGRKVLIKTPRSSMHNRIALPRLKREFEIGQEIRSDCVLRVLDHVTGNNSLALIFDDPGGFPLSELLSNEIPSLRETLSIAARLAGIINTIHQLGFIHLNLLPEDIWLHPETEKMILAGMGSASRAPRGIEEDMGPKIIEGALAYTSPEQTGRTARIVDYRTDFYAFGIILYKMLTGQVPFRQEDPLELIHAHVAMLPPSPADLQAATPRVVSDITMKLLSKQAERRYQSAKGLEADLVRCLEDLEEDGSIPDFPLGLNDYNARFELPQRLYGRTEELVRLSRVFETAGQGKPQLLRVFGAPGVGKTALVRQLQQMVLIQNGHFISAKWGELEDHGRYHLAANALQDILHFLLTIEEGHLENFRKELEEALGPNLNVLVDFLPLARTITGNLPKVTELPPEDAQIRLYQSIRLFLKVVARNRPLVIFYDDLQWADETSLDFIRGVFSKVTGRILLVCGYRNTAAAMEKLDTSLFHSLKASGPEMTSLNIMPLTKANVTKMVAETLQTDHTGVKPLAEKIYSGTAGNPYSVKTFLLSLWEDGLPEKTGAAWDPETIGQIKKPGSVEEIMERRFSHLSSEDLRIISIAAALDLHVSSEELALICGISRMDVEKHLIRGCEAHILIQQGGGYLFEHDQIRERAYMMIPAKERPRIHIRIARTLKKLEQNFNDGKKLFTIADHLNRGISQIKKPAERLDAARINLEAARYAKAGAAFPAALRYYQNGLQIIGKSTWETQYPLCHELHRGASETAFLTANFETADRIAQSIHTNAKTILDRIPAYDLQISIAYARRGETKALELTLEVLRSLGVEIPEETSEGKSLVSMDATLNRMKQAASSPDRDLAPMTDPEMRAAMQLIRRAIMTSVWVNSNLRIVLTIKAAQITLEYGYCPETCFAFVLAGGLFCARMNDIDSGRMVADYGLRLSERPDAELIRPACLMMHHMSVSPWYEHPDAFLEGLSNVYRDAVKSGNFITSGYAAIAFSGAGFWTGMSLPELEPKIRTYYEDAVQHGLERIQGGLLKIHEVVTAILGQPELTIELAGSQALVKKIQYKLEENADHTAEQISRACEMIVSFILRRHEQAYDLSLELASQPMTSGGGAMPLDTYVCLGLLGRHRKTNRGKQTDISRNLPFIEKRLKRMQIRAKAAPMNYKHRVDLIRAELFRIQGETSKAAACYEHAINAARREQYLNELAFANELAAEFYLDLGVNSVAAMHLRQAADAYHKWGAKAKVTALSAAYSELLNQGGAPPEERHHPPDETNPAFTTGNAALDMESIRLAVKALSLELNLEKLIQDLMNILLQNVAAQKGFLLREKEKGIELVASISVENPVVRFPLAIDLEHCDLLSRSIVRYVGRTGETVVLGNAAKDSLLQGDAYIQRESPKSILCIPVIHQGKSVAILYLENNLMQDAFSGRRLSVVNLIFSQAAAYLENAQLHENLKQEVHVRRQAEHDLRQALTDVASLKDKLEAENIYLKEEIKNTHGFEEIIGESKALKRAFYKIDMVASTQANVLIQGETGTGKELVARAIHAASTRKDAPFIRVNCAALPAGLIESELFGHEKGAFTGALEQKAGRFELADTGTIFLDEIGDLPLELQAKLLRVLQESEFERLGSTQTIKVDIRVIAATNRNLEKESLNGNFRSDLYYRLSVFPIDLPPLRERKSDIPLLVSHFVAKKERILGKTITQIPREIMTGLKNYHWPGNVRELENVIERAMILSPDQTLVLDESFSSRGGQPSGRKTASAGSQRLETIERQHILDVIESCGWKIKGKGNAAERLGLHPSTLKSRMKKLGIERP